MYRRGKRGLPLQVNAYLPANISWDRDTAVWFKLNYGKSFPGQSPRRFFVKPCETLHTRLLSAPLGARIDEERTLNRIDSNQLFLMKRLEVDSMWL